MRALILHNPRSGFGSDAIFEFERTLLLEGDECVFRMLPEHAHVSELLEDAEAFDLVVISGGDGTCANALFALREKDVAVCIFPSGTANLLSESIGLAPEPGAMARACRERITRSIDTAIFTWYDMDGTSHVHGFSVMAGSGFDAQLMQAALPNKKTMGSAAYYAAALANPKPQVSTFTINVDGQTHTHRGICCLVANTARIQGNIELVPNSKLDDGQLEVIVVCADEESKASPASYLVPALFCLVDKSGKRLGRPSLVTYKGAHIEVHSSQAVPIEVDGEVTEGLHTDFVVDVVPSAVNIIVDQMSPYF